MYGVCVFQLLGRVDIIRFSISVYLETILHFVEEYSDNKVNSQTMPFLIAKH